MTPNVWLSTHPYLRALAVLQGLVDSVAVTNSSPPVCIPSFDRYSPDFHAGVPLLHSGAVEIDGRYAEMVVRSAIARLAAGPSLGKLAEEAKALNADLWDDTNAPRHVVAWLFDNQLFVPAHPGLLRYLGWTVLARSLAPVVRAFASWRDEETWLRNYCPTCGALPAMAQLVLKDTGHLRFLSCGFCGTRWRFRRARCPFCQAEHDHGLPVLEIENESELRIDYCNHCTAYIKTYYGQGGEELFLADWTSIHLDLLACDRGLKRQAGSLYGL